MTIASGKQADGRGRDWGLPTLGSGAQVTSASPETQAGGCFNLRVCYISLPLGVASTDILFIDLMFFNHSLIVYVLIYIWFNF